MTDGAVRMHICPGRVILPQSISDRDPSADAANFAYCRMKPLPREPRTLPRR